jgi:hypothetical protein
VYVGDRGQEVQKIMPDAVVREILVTSSSQPSTCGCTAAASPAALSICCLTRQGLNSALYRHM